MDENVSSAETNIAEGVNLEAGVEVLDLKRATYQCDGNSTMKTTYTSNAASVSSSSSVFCSDSVVFPLKPHSR